MCWVHVYVNSILYEKRVKETIALKIFNLGLFETATQKEKDCKTQNKKKTPTHTRMYISMSIVYPTNVGP